MNRSVIIFFHLSGSLIISFFQNCWGFICKIFLEVCFYFTFGLESFIIERIFNNIRIDQDLGYIEDAIERPNQTVFLSVNIRFYIVMMTSSVRQFSFFYYGVFQFIKLIAMFSKINDFTLRKKFIVNYIFLIPLNG